MLFILLAASALFAADDSWTKVKEVKTGSELRVYKICGTFVPGLQGTGPFLLSRRSTSRGGRLTNVDCVLTRI